MPQLAVLLSTLIWGATFPATKVALEQIPPFSFLFLRFLLGSVLALAMFLAFRGRLPSDRRLLWMSGMATVFLFLGYACQTVGLRLTTASNSAFITVLYVVLVPLFLRRFGARTWVSAGLAVGGLWLLVDPQVSLNPGDLLTLTCAAAFAGHIICLESYTRRADPSSLLIWQLLLVTVPMGLLMAAEAPASEAFAPTTPLVVGLAVTGVLATGALAIQVWAQRLLPAQLVALLFSLEPAIATWLAWYFLGEQFGPSGWVGSALILAAVLIGAGTREVTGGRPFPCPATRSSVVPHQ